MRNEKSSKAGYKKVFFGHLKKWKTTMPKDSTAYHSHYVTKAALNAPGAILGVYNEDGTRRILNDRTEIKDFVSSGGTVQYYFATMEGASYWQEKGFVIDYEMSKALYENTNQQMSQKKSVWKKAAKQSTQTIKTAFKPPAPILGIVDDDKTRRILNDPTEILDFVSSGGTVRYYFATMEGASFWQKHNVIRYCDNAVACDDDTKQQKDKKESVYDDNTKQQKVKKKNLLKKAAKHCVQKTKQAWNAAKADDDTDHKTHSGTETETETETETDLNVPTPFIGLVNKGKRDILGCPTEIGNYILSGGTAHYRFPTFEGASHWYKLGIVKQCHNAIGYDENTKDNMGQEDKSGKKTAKKSAKTENTESQPVTKTDVSDNRIFLGLVGEDGDRAIFNEPEEIGCFVMNGGTAHYRFPTFAGASYWQNHGIVRECDNAIACKRRKKKPAWRVAATVAARLTFKILISIGLDIVGVPIAGLLTSSI